jgi:hypothetical protein
MGIRAWPRGVHPGSTVRCMVCERNIELVAATAGMVDATGVQTFACNDHFWNETQLIIGYSRFVAEKLRAPIQTEEHTVQGDTNAWSIH